LAVQKLLINRGIHPERKSPSEDVKKLQRKLVNEEKKQKINR